jgi:formylglycine-generating enzyme required for sulfatase activity
LRKNVQRLTAEVEQFSKQIGESAKLQTPTPTPTPIPAPAPTPNTNAECEDLRKNVQRLSAEEELLSAQLGDYAPPIPFARQMFSAPTSEFTIPTPKQTPRVPVPCYRFVLGGKTRLDHSNQYGIEFMQIPASVTIKSFCMGKYEVTEAQWQAVVGNRTVGFDSGGGRIQMGSRNWPVQAVTWFDAQNFISRLNRLNDGWMYRLPTEAEWEYAARAGTTGNYAGNLSEIAWYGANSGGQAHAVGGKQPNAWGLYDMIGNVFEMSNDGGTLTRIGGSYASPAEDVGGPVRYAAPPASHKLTEHGDYRDGFRGVAVPRGGFFRLLLF